MPHETQVSRDTSPSLSCVFGISSTWYSSEAAEVEPSFLKKSSMPRDVSSAIRGMLVEEYDVLERAK